LQDKEEGLTKLSNNSDYNQPADRVNANRFARIVVTSLLNRTSSPCPDFPIGTLKLRCLAIVTLVAPCSSLTEFYLPPSLPSLYRSADTVQLRLFSQAA